MSLTTTTKSSSATDLAPNMAPDRSAAAKPKSPDTKQVQPQESEYNGNVPMDLIEPDPKNRDKIDDAKVKAMSESIASDGLLQPVVLRLMPGGNYRLIAGEHRWRAFKLLKRPTIAARIYRNETEVSAARKKTIENFQRVSLTPIEEARKYLELSDLGMKQTDIGMMLGKSQPVVANALRLLELPGVVQTLVGQGKLTAAHAGILCRFAKWPVACIAMAEQAVKQETSSKELAREYVPFHWHLERAGKLVMIETGPGYYRPTFTIPESLQKDPDFLQIGKTTWACFAPEKWTPIAKVAEAEFAKKQRAETGRRGAGGKMSDKEKADRKKLIGKNKASRVAIDVALANAVGRLKGVTGIDDRALAVICDRANRSMELAEAAEKLGIKLPKLPRSIEDLHKLGLPTMVKLVAVTLMLVDSDEKRRFAGSVPKSAEFIAGKFKAPVTKLVVDKDLEEAKQVKAGHDAGLSGAEIAKKAGISLPKVQNIKKVLGLVPGPASAAKAAKK